MASLAKSSRNWADDEEYDEGPDRTAALTVTQASEPAVEDAADGEAEGKTAEQTTGHDGRDGDAANAAPTVDEESTAPTDQPMDDRVQGKRGVSVDAETDRMARLFLGKEDEIQAKMRLKVVQSNPNSHLSSAKTFDEMGLSEALLRGVQQMGFEKPSAIQAMALPMCLRNPPENLLAQAQSGSGKTAAFCLAGLSRVDTSLDMPQLLIVTPTRELAVQCVDETLRPMAQFMVPKLQIYAALRGVRPPPTGIRDHAVVGTPGTILNALKRRVLLLRHVTVFVLDEADNMLEEPSGPGSGHRDSCVAIKRYLPPREHQTLLFSATFPRHVKDFGLMIADTPVNEITLPNEKDLILDVITQLWIDLRPSHLSRLDLLQELYDVLEMGQSIIFCRTKMDADNITNTLQQGGFTCSNLHGDLMGTERDECMSEFRLGRNKVLITTNVLARGVDIPAVSLVVNYDMPTLGRSAEADFDTYLHRIGRTGRFGRRGVAINLIHDSNAYRVLEGIDMHFSGTTSMMRRAPTDMEELEKIIVEESAMRVPVLDPLASSS